MNKAKIKIEKCLKDLKTEIDITNKIANTNFTLDDEDIFRSPVYLLDKETDKLIAFNFPRDIFTFLFGIRYKAEKGVSNHESKKMSNM